MRLFNSFQLTLFFALAPFGLSWLYHQEFKWQGAAFIVACLAYVVSFWFVMISINIGLKEAEKNW